MTGLTVQLEGVGLAALPVSAGTLLVSADGHLMHADGRSSRSATPLASACAAPDGAALLLGAEDGRLLRADADGAIIEVARPTRRWIEHVAASPASGIIAASSGKTLWLFDRNGTPIASRDHGSSLTGIALDARGKRCAVSHYNGASLHWTSGQGSAQQLDWKGSHTGVTLAPEGGFLVTAMQENALHGWTLPAGKHMRMAGYPAKTRSMAWTHKGRYLATSGAPSLICWPFMGKDGPMGKPPLELPGSGPLVSRVAAHPKQEVVAAGFEDGLVVLFRLDSLDSLKIAPASGAAVTGLCFSADGAQLALVREDGSGLFVDLA
jgi:WD40 repeat protein